MWGADITEMRDSRSITQKTVSLSQFRVPIKTKFSGSLYHEYWHTTSETSEEPVAVFFRVILECMKKETARFFSQFTDFVLQIYSNIQKV
jgi:hypothetical protein